MSLGKRLGNGLGSMRVLRSAGASPIGDMGSLSGPRQNLVSQLRSRKKSMRASLVTQNCPFPNSGSRLTSGPGDVRSDHEPGSNIHKTISLPNKRESFFMKFVRGGGWRYTRYKREKARVPEVARCLTSPRLWFVPVRA